MRMDIRLHFTGFLFFLFVPVTFADLEVEGYVGDDVVLPCTHSGPDVPVTLLEKEITFEWRFKDITHLVHMVVQGENMSDQQDKQFANRAVPSSDAKMGNFSVKLTNLNENDSGRYTCTVVLNEKHSREEHVQLTIKEKPTTEAPATKIPTPENRKNSGYSSMTMGPQKTLFLLILVLMMIMSV